MVERFEKYKLKSKRKKTKLNHTTRTKTTSSSYTQPSLPDRTHCNDTWVSPLFLVSLHTLRNDQLDVCSLHCKEMARTLTGNNFCLAPHDGTRSITTSFLSVSLDILRCIFKGKGLFIRGCEACCVTFREGAEYETCCLILQ